MCIYICRCNRGVVNISFLHANDRIINKKNIYQSNVQLMHENMDTFVINKQYEIKYIDTYYNKSIYYNIYIK